MFLIYFCSFIIKMRTPQFLLLLAVTSSLYLVMAHSSYIYRNHNTSLFWGTYRPTAFHGMRARELDGTMGNLLTALAWYSVDDYSGWRNIRVASEFQEGLKSVGYTEHDGRIYSRQTVVDALQSSESSGSLNDWILTIDTVKAIRHDGEDNEHEIISNPGWSVRVKGTSKSNRRIAICYVVTHDQLSELEDKTSSSKSFGTAFDPFNPNVLNGYYGNFGKKTFKFTVNDNIQSVDKQKLNSVPSLSKGDINNLKAHGHEIPEFKRRFSSPISTSINWRTKEILSQVVREHGLSILRGMQGDHPAAASTMIIPDVPEFSESSSNNLHIFQRVYEGDFEFEIAFSEGDFIPLLNEELTREITERSFEFQARFAKVFPLKSNTRLGYYALSNLLGGVSFLHGTRLEKSKESDEIVESEVVSLFSDSPCKTFFPRGFFWDSGFHNLIISSWDPHMSLDVLESWYSSMDSNGWIAREQILGNEARSRVPEQFIIQNRKYANPPALILPVMNIILKLAQQTTIGDKFNLVSEDLLFDSMTADDTNMENLRSNTEVAKERLMRLYPKLKKHLNWYFRTQKGQLTKELQELFKDSVDPSLVFRWRGRKDDHTLTSGLDDYPRSSTSSKTELHVDLASWMYFATHSLSFIAKSLSVWFPEDRETFEKDMKVCADRARKIKNNILALHWSHEHSLFTDILAGNESPSVITYLNHTGYVSLFPFFLGVLEPNDNIRLRAVLKILTDPDQLYSPFGVRSLSKSHPLYGKNENYWRGPIWININYLILSALYHYSRKESCTLKTQLKSAYDKIRSGLITNMQRSFDETGTIWENYDSSSTGKGSGSRPFSGWSSLILLILSERYIDLTHAETAE